MAIGANAVVNASNRMRHGDANVTLVEAEGDFPLSNGGRRATRGCKARRVTETPQEHTTTMSSRSVKLGALVNVKFKVVALEFTTRNAYVYCV